MGDKTVSGDCGMPVGSDDFHPFAACLMFKACRNSSSVAANLEFCREYFTADKDAQIATLTAKLERAMELANEMEHESFCESLRLDREPGYCNCTRGDILRLED